MPQGRLNTYKLSPCFKKCSYIADVIKNCTQLFKLQVQCRTERLNFRFPKQIVLEKHEEIGFELMCSTFSLCSVGILLFHLQLLCSLFRFKLHIEQCSHVLYFLARVKSAVVPLQELQSPVQRLDVVKAELPVVFAAGVPDSRRTASVWVAGCYNEEVLGQRLEQMRKPRVWVHRFK